MKKVILAGMMILVLASQAAAQTRPMPFCDGPLSREEFARAVENCDKVVLNARNCEVFVTAANEAFDIEPKLKNTSDLAEYIRGLRVLECPLGLESKFARIMPDGKVDLRGYGRQFKKGEQCLFDATGGFWFASALCCNYVTSADLPMPNFGTANDPPPSSTPIADQLREKPKPELEPDDSRRRRGSESRNPLSRFGSWYGRHKRWTVPGTIALGALAICTIPEPRCFVNENILIVKR